MAKSAAERQSAYRARRNDGDGERRLNGWISVAADCALDRLAKRYGVTRQGMIETLICEADEAILKTIKDIESAEWNDYLNVTA
jgi:hypothetical protein